MQPVSRESTSGRRVVWLDALLVFASAYVYLDLLPDCFDLFDESLVAATAERMYRGEILYRDVFSYWNPGVFWLYEGLFAVAGVSVATMRVPLIVGGALAAVGVWRLARDHAGRAPAMLAGLAAPLVCYPVWWMASPHWYATFTAIASAVTLRGCLGSEPGSGAALATGALCGAGFIMLQPVGVFVSVAIAGTLIWDGAWMESRTTALKRTAVLALGALIPIGAMYVYFGAHRALGDMIYATLIWNLTQFRPIMDVSYGTAYWMPTDAAFRVGRMILMALPPAVTLVALLLTGSQYVRRVAAREDRRLFALSAVAAGSLGSNYYFPDVVHLAFGAPPAFAVLAALLSRLEVRHRGRLLARTVVVLLFAAVVFVGLGSLERYRSRCSSELVTARGTIAIDPAKGEELARLLRFLERNLSPDEPFYVYSYGPGYNFLSGHMNVAPLEGVGTFSTDEQIAEVISALDANQVRYVVLSHFYGRQWLQRFDTVLERYIRSEYHVAKEFSTMLVLERDAPGKRGPKLEKRGQR